ncbi:MAG TPA: cellulose binding domain-containing protein [Micromonosporaceae bacterium]|nr:cellulose binding domain-containing protein [Micromonosporaceae bacterium]
MLRLGIASRVTARSSRRRPTLLVPLLATLVAVTLAAPASAAPSDAVPPTEPGPVEVTDVTTTSLTLRWAASVDDVAVAGYQVREVFEDTVRTRVTATNSITITGLMRSRTYRFWVSAFDAAGNLSPSTSTVQVTLEPGDHAPPTAPGTPVASRITGYSLMLTWQASTDDAYVARYQIFRVVGGELIGMLSSPLPTPIGDLRSSMVFNLSPDTTYTFVVRAVDEAGNLSPLSPPVTVTTAGSVPWCRVQYRVTSQWPGGFQAAVRVTNTSAELVSGWQFGWLFQDGQTVRHLWHGVLDRQEAGSVTVRNAAWNARIPSGGSVEFAFLGTWNAANGVPMHFTLNGRRCGEPPPPPPS